MGPARWVMLLVGAVAYAARVVPTLQGGGLLGLQGYDGSVYYSAAIGLANGLAPYRDFLVLHPPGIMLALAPFALLGRVIGQADAFAVARLAWIGLGALNAALVARIILRYGRTPALLAGLGYAVFLPALVVEHSTTLEAATSTLLLGALLLLSGPRVVRHGPVRPVLLAGVLLGASSGVKIWGVLIGIAVLAWAWPTLGRRLTGWLALGATLGVTVICLPFFLVAPSTMWRMVVIDQLGRRRVPIVWVDKLRDMTGISAIPTPHPVLLLVLVLVLLAIGIGLAAQLRTGRLAAAVFAGSWAMLLYSPSWSLDYASLAGPSMTVMLGAAMVVLLRLLRGRWLRVAAVVVLLAGLVTYAVKTFPQLHFGTAFPAAELRAGLDVPGCVTSDEPSALILTGVVQRNLHRGCPLMVDLGGYSYDLRPEADRRVSRAQNWQWQRYTVAYLRSGDVTMIVRFRNDVGFSNETNAIVSTWPRTVKAKRYAVQAPAGR